MEKLAYSDLRLYVGPRTRCMQCDREFLRGEVISVTDYGLGTFCLSNDIIGGCLKDYTSQGPCPSKFVIGEPMAYREKNASGLATTVPAAQTHPLLLGLLAALLTLVSAGIGYYFFVVR